MKTFQFKFLDQTASVQNYMDFYLKNKATDCILYSEDGSKFKIHKELFGQTDFLRVYNKELMQLFWRWKVQMNAKLKTMSEIGCRWLIFICEVSCIFVFEAQKSAYVNWNASRGLPWMEVSLGRCRSNSTILIGKWSSMYREDHQWCDFSALLEISRFSGLEFDRFFTC